MRVISVILLTAILLCGCAKKSDTAKPVKSNNTGKETSAARTLVNGFTGRTAVKAGKKARATIQDVSKQQNNDLNEIMGDK